MYKYYEEVIREEHYLLAKEIATLYNIQTKTGKPAYNFISSYLQLYMKQNNLKQLYYYTKNGMAKVYPREIYHKVIIEFITNLIKNNQVNKEIAIRINDVNYIIKYNGCVL